MGKIFNAINNNTSAIGNISNYPTAIGRNGEKYRLSVDLNGNVIAMSVVPQNIIFMGSFNNLF